MEIAKVYTCPGTSKLQLIVHRKIYLSHIKEQIIHKELIEALTELKQYLKKQYETRHKLLKTV